MKKLTFLLALTPLGALAGAQNPAVRALRDLSLKPEIRRAAIDAGLAELAARSDASFTGPDAALEMELARIGRDRRARPEVYARALRRIPREVQGPVTRAPRQPHPSLNETESERLVWEYLLLAPSLQGEGGASLQDSTTALVRIGNDACVPVLAENFFKDASGAEGGSALVVHQSIILGTLASIPSARSLDAILDCAAAAERQLWKLDARIATLTDPNDRINASMERWHPLEEAARVGDAPDNSRWAAVLASYKPKDADPLKAQTLAQARRRRRR